MRKFFERFDAAVLTLCGVATILLVLLTVQQVLARYFFQASSIAIQELLWHLFGLVFLFSASATFSQDRHVRVDIFYSRLGEVNKAWVNLLGTILFMIPSMAVLFWFGYQDVLQARSFSSDLMNSSEQSNFIVTFFLQGEGSPDPGGLPARWIVKSFLPISALMLMIQGLFSLTSDLASILRRKER